MRYKVKRVCAWCGLDMGVANFEADVPGRVTHGICEECLRAQMDEIKRLKGGE